jgi:hypothetical protein
MDKIGMVHHRENCISASLGVKCQGMEKRLDRVFVPSISV